MTEAVEIDSALTRLESVLATERVALMSGQIHRIGDLMSEKMEATQAVDALVARRHPGLKSDRARFRLQGVVNAAKENALHFKAAQNGLRSLAARVGNFTQDSYVGAYNSNGLQTPFSKATGNYLKKA